MFAAPQLLATGEVEAIGWLLIILVMVVLAFIAFVFVRRHYWEEDKPQSTDSAPFGLDALRDLLRQGKLTQEEFAAVQRHPLSSAEIIQPIAYLRELVPAIRHHHERFDGKGYPDGLSGESIPFSARILTVADSFEAMTSDRPYRKALSFEKAMAEIRRCRGTQFDPAIVDAFLILSPAIKEQSRGRQKDEK